MDDLKKNNNNTNTLLVLVSLVVTILLLTLILQYSWNFSVPTMFSGAKEITFSAAFFLLIVSFILFKN